LNEARRLVAGWKRSLNEIEVNGLSDQLCVIFLLKPSGVFSGRNVAEYGNQTLKYAKHVKLLETRYNELFFTR